MKRNTAVSILAVLLLVLLQSMAIADTSLEELLSGRLAPLTIKLGDLDSQWRRFSVVESGSPFTDYLSIMAAREMTPTPPAIYYTKGATHQVAVETYLVAYQAKPQIVGIARMLRSMDDSNPPVLTPEGELSMSLLNLRTIGALRDIRAFNLDEEINESKALLGVDEYDENAPSQENDPSSNNLHQIGLALNSYMSDYDDVLPPIKDPEQVKGLLVQYSREDRIFADPRTGELYAINTILSKHKLAHIQSPWEMAVYYEAVPREDGSRAVLFLDGHVQRISPEEWPIIKRKSKIP